MNDELLEKISETVTKIKGDMSDTYDVEKKLDSIIALLEKLIEKVDTQIDILYEISKK